MHGHMNIKKINIYIYTYRRLHTHYTYIYKYIYIYVTYTHTYIYIYIVQHTIYADIHLCNVGHCALWSLNESSSTHDIS